MVGGDYLIAGALSDEQRGAADIGGGGVLAQARGELGLGAERWLLLERDGGVLVEEALGFGSGSCGGAG